MSEEPLDYEAGTELDAEAQAFLDKEDSKPEFTPTPEYDPATDPKLKAKAAKPAAEPVVTDDEPTPEEKAEALGWAPQDQWRGPSDKWVDAETFLKRGENNPRILRERLETVEKRSAETIARMERMNQQALDRQKQEFDGYIADLKKKRDQAVIHYARQGDDEAAEQAAEEWDSYIAGEAGKDPVAQQQEGPSQEFMTKAQEAFKVWPAKDAFEKDATFRAAAVQEAEKYVTLEPAAQYEAVDKALAKRFPEYYPKPADNGAPPAGSRQMDGVRISGQRTTNYANRLPATARAQGERFVKQGLFPNLEAYAKDFVNQ